MHLRLDHLILRAGDPEATLAELARRARVPVLAEVKQVVGVRSGVAHAGSVDIEVLGIGDTPPAQPLGYGLGLVADVPLREAVAGVRALGLPTSAPVRGIAGEGDGRRQWHAVQIHGLLPNPFDVPVSTRRLGLRDRVAGAAGGTLGRVPAIARVATAEPGDSMVVLTEYDFDVDAWRATGAGGPEVVGVEVGTAGSRAAWERLPLGGEVELALDDEGPAGVRRVTFAGARRKPFALGAVRFDWR